jgi:hypothetical protein
MTLPSPKVCRKIVQLHALIGSPNANEAEAARQKLTEVLAKHGLTWNDLPRILSAIQAADERPRDRSSSGATSTTATDGVPEVNVLDLVLRLLEQHISITPEEHLAVALWILHAWLFDRFPITRRLALLSPVRGCGKTVLLCLIQLLPKNSPVFAASREQIRRWVATCSLVHDPEIPMALRNRAADNWRPLISMAESLGHGDEARAAATKLSANRLYEDVGVTLLEDIRAVFEELGVDRIASALLVSKLINLNDGAWAEWRGPRDDRPPRKLTQGELARLLRDFQIRPRTIWPKERQSSDRSSRGYLRSQFEAAWRAYCTSADTPTQAPKIIDVPKTAGASS